MEDFYEVKKLSLGERIKYFFINPGKVFEQYIEKPTVWIKIAVIAVITIISAVVQSMHKDIYITKMVEKFQNMKMPAQSIELTKKTYETTLSAPYLIVMGIVGIAAVIAFASLIYWGLTKLFKGEITYGQTAAVYTLAVIPKYLLELFQSINSLAANTYTGLDKALNPTYLSGFTSVVNIFSIWSAVLLVIGLSKVGKISKKKSSIIVILIILITLIFTLGSVAYNQVLMSKVQ